MPVKRILFALALALADVCTAQTQFDANTFIKNAPWVKQRGAWSGSTAYAVNDQVQQGGASYVAVQANTNQVPPNATYWTPLGGGSSSVSVNGSGVSNPNLQSGTYVSAT